MNELMTVYFEHAWQRRHALVGVLAVSIAYVVLAGLSLRWGLAGMAILGLGLRRRAR